MPKLMALLLTLALLLSACAQPGTALEPQNQALSPAEKSSPVPEISVAPTKPPASLPATGDQQACSGLPLAEGLLVAIDYQMGGNTKIKVVDPSSGQPLCAAQPLELHSALRPAFSADGQWLAVTDAPDSYDAKFSLHLIHLPAWEVSNTTQEFKGVVNGLAFDSKSTRLALAYGALPAGDAFMQTSSTLALVDLHLQPLAQVELSFVPSLIAFTPDGERLVLFGGTILKPASGSDPGVTGAQAALLNASDLSTAWEKTLPEIHSGSLHQPGEASEPYLFQYWNPAAVLSPDGSRLYVVHSDEDRLTTIDLNQRTVKTVEIRPQLSWLERLLYATAGVAYAKGGNGTSKEAFLSPDGRRLFVTGSKERSGPDAQGNFQFELTPLGLQVVDVDSGAELARLDTATSSASLSPDGELLYLYGRLGEMAFTDIVETGSLQTTAHLLRQNLTPARLLGGATVLLAQHDSPNGATIAAVDPEAVRHAPNNWQAKGWMVLGYPLLNWP